MFRPIGYIRTNLRKIIRTKENRTKSAIHCCFLRESYFYFELVHVNGTTSFYHSEVFVTNIRIILEERLIGTTQNSLNECQRNGQFSNVLRF